MTADVTADQHDENSTSTIIGVGSTLVQQRTSSTYTASKWPADASAPPRMPLALIQKTIFFFFCRISLRISINSNYTPIYTLVSRMEKCRCKVCHRVDNLAARMLVDCTHSHPELQLAVSTHTLSSLLTAPSSLSVINDNSRKFVC